MIHALRRRLSAPQTLARLEALAAGAPASAPVSLRLSLAEGGASAMAGYRALVFYP